MWQGGTGWPALELRGTGAPYIIGASPWQLLYLAGWQIARRLKLWANRTGNCIAYWVHQWVY
jgi:hypothetical protein